MLDWLFPQTIETFPSKFNEEIRVVKTFGRLSVVVGEYQQSGPMIEGVWRKALNKLPYPLNPLQIRKILILGLGSGTILDLLRQHWPNARIRGIEIDPVMVEIGRKYFALSEYPELKIEINDAHNLMKRFIEQKKRFGLVIVDIYKGNVVGRGMDMEFIGTCRDLLEKDGCLIVNLLVFGSKAVEAKKLVEKLRLEPGVEVIKVDYNYFAFASSGKM